MRYAAYGSNLHPLRLQERTPSARLLGTEALAGFAIRFVKRGRDGSGKCTLVESTASSVHVAVYEIEDAEKPRLDALEGLGRGYSLATLELPRLGRCLTYLGQPEHLDPTLAPYSWYKELVLVGCEVHRFPEAYVREIAVIESVVDPDPERHELHMALVRRARRPARR
ncbi:MAG: gamma-glutamylcyclotransferase family protein [Myxococcota bacterium]